MCMSATLLPPDYSDLPLWRLILLLDDIEREQGASCAIARAVARAIAQRLGMVSPEVVDLEVIDAAR